MIASGDHQYGSSAPRVIAVVGRDLPRSSPAEAARTIVDGSTTGALSTISTAEPVGTPFGSVVSYALSGTGDPLFVISGLAEHTRNLQADDRASLLVTETTPAGSDPLSLGRVTLLGAARRLDEAEQADGVARVAARVPAVSGYAGYGDFACWRLRVASIRWVGGFGAMDWVDVADYAAAVPDPVIPHRQGVVDHMNADHADAGVEMCARALRDAGHGLTVTSATMRDVDRFGCDYVADVDDGVAMVRLAFGEPATGTADVRRLVVELLHGARE